MSNIQVQHELGYWTFFIGHWIFNRIRTFYPDSAQPLIYKHFCLIMKKISRFLFIFSVLSWSAAISAQTLSVDLLPTKVKKALQNFVFIESGSFTSGLYMGSDSLQCALPQKQSVESFYLNCYEVSVGDYQEFIADTRDQANHYDSTVWTKDYHYSYNEPMARNYFWHPNFYPYPIVGITWQQAVRYCQWKTDQLNYWLEKSPYKVTVRLPSQIEWEYAALFTLPTGSSSTKNERIKDRRVYPWDGLFLLRKKDGQFYTNCNSGPLKTMDGVTVMEFPSDGFLYTAPVKSYQPNEAGLYQMAGNVAEWTSDNYSTIIDRYKIALDNLEDEGEANPQSLSPLKSLTLAEHLSNHKIIKGGSWVDGPFYMQTGVFKVQDPGKATCTTGFRLALEIEKK